jgi:hypothetical protein
MTHFGHFSSTLIVIQELTATFTPAKPRLIKFITYTCQIKSIPRKCAASALASSLNFLIDRLFISTAKFRLDDENLIIKKIYCGATNKQLHKIDELLSKNQKILSA